MCLFVFIAGTITVKIFFQVIAGDDLGFGRALGKNNPYFFAARRPSLQSKCWTGLISSVGSVEVDRPFFHDLADLFFADTSAVHPAESMFGINDGRRMPVKRFSFFWLVPAPDEKSQKKEPQQENRNKGVSLLHADKCNQQAASDKEPLTACTYNGIGKITLYVRKNETYVKSGPAGWHSSPGHCLLGYI